MIAADDQKIWYSPHVLALYPVWEQYDYSSVGSPIRKIEAKISSTHIYGVALTNSGQAWRLKKEGSPNVVLGSSAFSNTDYLDVTQG